MVRPPIESTRLIRPFLLTEQRVLCFRPVVLSEVNGQAEGGKNRPEDYLLDIRPAVVIESIEVGLHTLEIPGLPAPRNTQVPAT